MIENENMEKVVPIIREREREREQKKVYNANRGWNYFVF